MTQSQKSVCDSALMVVPGREHVEAVVKSAATATVSATTVTGGAPSKSPVGMLGIIVAGREYVPDEGDGARRRTAHIGYSFKHERRQVANGIWPSRIRIALRMGAAGNASFGSDQRCRDRCRYFVFFYSR